MQTYQFLNALGSTLEQMSEMHNASFRVYFVPLTMTPEMTADETRGGQLCRWSGTRHRTFDVRKIPLHKVPDSLTCIRRRLVCWACSTCMGRVREAIPAGVI